MLVLSQQSEVADLHDRRLANVQRRNFDRLAAGNSTAVLARPDPATTELVLEKVVRGPQRAGAGIAVAAAVFPGKNQNVTVGLDDECFRLQRLRYHTVLLRQVAFADENENLRGVRLQFVFLHDWQRRAGHDPNVFLQLGRSGCLTLPRSTVGYDHTCGSAILDECQPTLKRHILSLQLKRVAEEKQNSEGE